MAAFAAGCGDEVAGGGDTRIDVRPDTSGLPDSAPSDTSDTGGEAPETGPVDTGEEDEALALTEVLPGKGLTIGLEQVELMGSGFFQGVQVFFGESLAQDIFVLSSRRLVVLTPPRGPGLVQVRVVDPETGATARLEAAFLYYDPVSVVSVEPAVGHVLGGERVTVRGEGFVEGSVLLFGQKIALQTQRIDDQTLTALVPDGRETGPVDVRVSNREGVGALEDGFTYVDAPAIDFVRPPTGALAGGNVIEIGGRSFHEPLTVMIGGQPLDNPRVIDQGRLTGIVPAAASEGPVDVSVSTTYGTGTRDGAYTYLGDVAPGVTELLTVSPGAGRLSGGEIAMLVGKGLAPAETLVVRFGGREARVLQVDALNHTAIVETPAGAAVGLVDVEVEQADVVSTLAGAFRYRADLRVTRVTPAAGPVAGGTAIEVIGEGFSPGLELRLGALAAASVEVVDGRTIRALTPPGAPGQADAVVILSGEIARAEDAFTYEAPYALWVVDPPQGAQAGGTFVTLVGSDFPSDAKVFFGARGATHVEVVSSTIITCKSPPGALGVVPVAVRSASRGEVAMADAFTYYDPTSAYGGTWGGAVEGDVNVTVLDGGSGAPLPDAFVMLWTDPRTPYQGFTNQDGQVTFSGPDLSGEQMVSASKPGYSRASVVEYNATNVTVYLNPSSPPSPGAPGPGLPPPIVRGKITNLGKAFPVPFGRCDSKWSAPGNLCLWCQSDTDCGAGYRCSELPNQVAGGESGRYCTSDCLAPSDCPSDFMCVPLVAGQPQQCAPKSGEITAFCDISNEGISPFFDDVKADPGIEVAPDGSFEFDTMYDNGAQMRAGDMAIYCWGGVYDELWFEFIPLVLGVERHVTLYPGDEVKLEIALDHPLNRAQYVELDPVPRGLEGPDVEYLFPHIDLGGDGLISIMPLYSYGGSPFVLEHFMSGLSGDLYDASFTFLAVSFSYVGNAYTATLHQRLTRLEDDVMFYRAGDAWEAERTGVTKNVNGLFWSGDNLVGVGSKGLVVRSIGRAWATQESGVGEDLRAVHGVEGGALVAVGDLGNITRWDGLLWEKQASPVTGDLRAVWMLSEDEGWAVGAYAAAQLDNGLWTRAAALSTRNLYGIYGFAANDVWAVGSAGQVVRFDGITWNAVPSGTSIGLRAVWGATDDDVWMVGEAGLALHWNGSELAKVQLDTTQTLTAIWGRTADDVTVVGSRGVAFHWDGAAWTRLALGAAAKNVDFLAIGGPPDAASGEAVMTGAHELVLGPILAVPEAMSPGEGGIMGADYRVSWQNQPGPDPHFSYVEIAIPTMFGPVPEWTMINDYDVQSILLPDFPNIEGTPGIDPGVKYLTVIRVYKEGFDIDQYSNSDLFMLGWRSWSVNQVVFTKL